MGTREELSTSSFQLFVLQILEVVFFEGFRNLWNFDGVLGSLESVKDLGTVFCTKFYF